MSSKYQETKNIYLKEKVETIAIRVPIGEKSIIKSHAGTKGKSLNAYIVDLIYADMRNSSTSKADLAIEKVIKKGKQKESIL